jgi:DNA processing protein
MSDLYYWLALNSLTDIGPVLCRRLVSVLGSPKTVFEMTMGELRNIEGIGENRARKILGFNHWDAMKKELERVEKEDITLITLTDSNYPEGLKQLPDAPILIYVKGNIDDTDKYAVSIIGSRKATNYGMQTAEKISYKLASCGLTVVSGMARGIDTVSHKGALKSGGRTIAVLGSGIDVPYPSSNRGLMNTIADNGAVISEFPLGSQPLREHFPRRNRIVSALSLGVIVIEATIDSGSLITVGYALDQGKEVFAVPGNINSINSKGTNDLIKKGARLIESAEDVIEELRPQIRGILREEKNSSEKLLSELSEDEKKLFSFLNSDPKHIDLIIREMEVSTGKVLSILLNLELKGIIRQSEGNFYSLN